MFRSVAMRTAAAHDQSGSAVCSAAGLAAADQLSWAWYDLVSIDKTKILIVDTGHQGLAKARPRQAGSGCICTTQINVSNMTIIHAVCHDAATSKSFLTLPSSNCAGLLSSARK